MNIRKHTYVARVLQLRISTMYVVLGGTSDVVPTSGKGTSTSVVGVGDLEIIR